MSVQTRMIRALKMPFVWVGFLLIILAFGMTDVLSGWMVSFQNEKRGMPDAAARYNLSGLWAGESPLPSSPRRTRLIDMAQASPSVELFSLTSSMNDLVNAPSLSSC